VQKRDGDNGLLGKALGQLGQDGLVAAPKSCTKGGGILRPHAVENGIGMRDPQGIQFCQKALGFRQNRLLRVEDGDKANKLGIPQPLPELPHLA
jgi:hypothetical protein